MFTDSPATPARVEMLLEVVRKMSNRKLDAATIRALLQPEGLPGLTTSSGQAAETIAAARELELIVDQADGMIRPSRQRDTRSARTAVVEAIDERVLGDETVEPWFALFYSFLLGRGESAGSNADEARSWETRFERELFENARPVNRFNDTKYRGLRRWFRYCGLGWHDSEDRFHPNPYERIARRLQGIFRDSRNLQIDTFMVNLSEYCPELDGGHIFLKANKGWDRTSRVITPGLAHALIDLHLDGALILNCPLDSDGWSIAGASPPFDKDNIRSNRISNIRYSPPKGTRENG